MSVLTVKGSAVRSLSKQPLGTPLTARVTALTWRRFAVNEGVSGPPRGGIRMEWQSNAGAPVSFSISALGQLDCHVAAPPPPTGDVGMNASPEINYSVSVDVVDGTGATLATGESPRAPGTAIPLDVPLPEQLPPGRFRVGGSVVEGWSGRAATGRMVTVVLVVGSRYIGSGPRQERFASSQVFPVTVDGNGLFLVEGALIAPPPPQLIPGYALDPNPWYSFQVIAASAAGPPLANVTSVESTVPAGHVDLNLTGWDNVGLIGTFSGPVRSLAVDRSGATIYAAAQYGGVWKTTDRGNSWRATMWNEANGEIGAVDLCATEPAFVYAATKQSTFFPSVQLYRSRDGAATWQLGAAVASTWCRAIAVHPSAPLRVYVAGDASLHVTRDGGANWIVRSSTIDGVIAANQHGIFDGKIDDVRIDPNTPDTLFIVARGRGIYRTSDGGRSWARVLGPGAGAKWDERGVISLGTISSATGKRVVAAKINSVMAFSRDGGDTWTLSPAPFSDIFNYFDDGWRTCIAASPTDENLVVAGEDWIYATFNGQAAAPTWTQYDGALHLDQQAIVFSPADPNLFYFCNDGLVASARRDGNAFAIASATAGLTAAQCIAIDVSQGTGGTVLACSTYHTGVLQSGSNDLTQWIDLANTEGEGEDEGGFVTVDPTNPAKVFWANWGQADLWSRVSPAGSISRQLMITGPDGKAIEVYPETVTVCPSSPQYVVASAMYGRMHLSRDGGNSWSLLCYPGGNCPWLVDRPDARGASPADPCGIASVTRYEYASAIVFAPGGPVAMAYVASRSGRLWQMTIEAGTVSWQALNPPVPPSTPSENALLSLAVSPQDANAIYLGYSAQSGSPKPIWRGTRQGQGFAWVDASGLLPRDSVLSLVVDEPAGGSRHLFAATYQNGAYVSTDNGANWHLFSEGLPRGLGTEMVFARARRQLYFAFNGRGIFRRAI